MATRFDIDLNGSCVAAGAVPDDGVNITGLEVGGTPLWGMGWGIQLKPGDVLTFRVDVDAGGPVAAPARPRLTLISSDEKEE